MPIAADPALPPEGMLPPGLVNPVHERLLAILYGPAAEAPALFEAWQSEVDMTDLDEGCYRLYPHLYARLRTFAPDHPFLGRLKGLFRRSLYRNNLLFQWARDVVERLRAAGIECLVLKGAALVGSIGFSAGFRPMADVDLLVRTADARRALAVADPLFRAVADDPLLADLHIQLRHGLAVQDDRRLQIDLHWRLAGTWVGGADPDAPFWETAEPIDLRGLPALTLAPTEQLFHVVVHGIPRNPVPTIRWISDSLDLLAAEGDRIDWDRLVGLAARFGQRPALRTGLAYLRARFGAAIPPTAIAALAPPDTAAERASFLVRTRTWAAPITLAEIRAMLPPRLDLLEERLPGRRRVAFLPDRMATPDLHQWLDRLGFDHIREHGPQSPVTTAVRADVLASDRWHRRETEGMEGLFRFAHSVDVGDGRNWPVFATVRRDAAGRWGLRVFDTSLADWPQGAVVFRFDAVMGFLQASLLGVDDLLPTPHLSGWTGFPDAVVAIPSPAGQAERLPPAP
ncbi:nucleotidyltransferase family protein [Stella sp.]|uniref:nucleotidyltransferase family protein n=1 Tax=Stella sp. TaxID=2912054 RepID=UPI0035B271C3